MLGTILASWLLADFLSGVGHWIEDRYLASSDTWIGRNIARPNEVHHTRPQDFLTGDYWTRNWTCILVAAIALVIGWLIGLPGWILLALAFTSQSNEVHAWGHQRCNRFITALQEIGLLQSARHHSVHHRSPHDVRYCIHTNWLNPLLDLVGFWSWLERGLAVVGVRTKCTN